MYNTEPLATGIVSNPTFVLEAENFKGTDGVVIESSDCINRIGVKGVGNDKLLFDSGVFPAGVLRGACQFIPRFTVSGISNHDQCMRLVIERIDNHTNEISAITEYYFSYREDTSPTWGTNLRWEHVKSKQIRHIYFSPIYKYRFKIYTGQISDGAYIVLDYLYLQFVQKGGFYVSTQLGLDNTMEPIYQLEGYWCAISTNSSGNGNELLVRSPIGSTGEFKGIFNSIETVIVSFSGDSGKSSATVSAVAEVASDVQNGYTVRVRVYNSYPSTTVYVQFLIYGVVKPFYV